MFMDDSNENIVLKYINPVESVHEQPEDNEEKSCIASECIFTRWSKPVSVHELMFVSKDVLLIRVENTLIFYNVGTKKEDIFLAGGNKSTPTNGDIIIPLDGIGCVDCCGIDLLALAEQPPIAKVVICRYPDLKVLSTLIDSSNSAAYKSILFLRLEYLIGLRDYPAFDLIIWAWRIREKLYVVNTGFIQPDQQLDILANGRDIYLSQTERDMKCRLQLWTMFISCKIVYTKRTFVELPSNLGIESSCWTHSGWFVFCDSSMNVYRTQPSTPNPEMCIEYTGTNSKTCALLCSTKQGFMLYTVNHLTCYKDTKGVFTKNWTIVINHTLQSMVAGENDVYGWSNEGTLLELTQKKEQILKVYGMNIKYFTFIKPADDTVATINEKNILQVWDVSTGEFKREIKLNGIATNISSNPFYYYIAISFKNGKVELFSTDPKKNSLDQITKIVLCDEELSAVTFFSNGNECIVTSFSTGKFYFISIKLGHTCSVVSEYHLRKQVIDIELFDDKKSSFITVLYKNHEITDVVGNNIVVFDANFNAIFELKDTQFYYTSMFKWIPFGITHIINIAFTVMLSKRIHLMKINVIQAKVLELKSMQLDHNVRDIKVSAGKNHCVTFSCDGTYILYEFNGDEKWTKVVVVNCSHWQTEGLIAAQVDVKARNILTLSRQGNFMCTSFKEICNHNMRFQHIDTSIIIDNMITKGIGFEDESRRITWIMINKENQSNLNEIAYGKQKSQIMKEFEKIKKELLDLFETNINGPEDTKINIEEFDLNVDYRQTFREKCKIERYEYEKKINDKINMFKMETKAILKEHWESLFVKPKSIYCLKKLYRVNNYPISMIDQEIIKKANQIIEKRILIKSKEEIVSNLDNISFSKDNISEMLNDEKKLNEYCEQSNDKLLMGSISHRFVDTVEHLNSQYNYYNLEMANDEIILLQFMVNKLKHSFNQLFDDVFNEKQCKLNILKKYNNRLREIETEFRLACKIEPTESSPIDYEWNQHEKTEKLIHVKNDEVLVKPHHILSNKQMSTHVNPSKEEQSRIFLDSDNFRQRSLIDMMDGVLEKRWEDELKKEILKPQCMLEKMPEDYTKDDLKAINEYEKLSTTRNDERIKYKKILEDEKSKINQYIKENIDEIDNNIFKLFQIKLKYNSAINQEYLKIIRLSKMLSDSEQRKQNIKLHRETNLEIEKTTVETIKIIAKTETTHSSLLNTIESLKHKNNVLNKRFKSEFPSKLIYEQALIAYNRRPKIQGITNYSSLLGYQFVNTIMDPNNDKLDLLCPEFIKYLDTLKVYDDYKYVEDYKLNMNRETWHKVCNFRRIKIESEFKISTYHKDAIDKVILLDNLIRDKEDKEAMFEKFKTSINRLENQDLCFKNDPEIQLVVKQGNTEIKLTGHYKDFNDTTLTDKNIIDDVNAEIKEMGKMKIDMLSNLLMYKRKCQFLKWEHAILKNHKITLYKYRFDVITSMKVTENMLHYLKFKAKGINIAKHAEQKVDKELAGFEITYSKEKKELTRRLDELVDRIRSVRKENEKTDKNIDQINVYLFELKSKIDYSLTNKLKMVSDLRMKMIMKRAQMISDIQELHKVVFMLQTELDLLLLKTYPTLYVKPQSTNIRK